MVAALPVYNVNQKLTDRLLLVYALVVSAALRTCLTALERTLCAWLRTCLCSLRHIL